MKYIPGQDYREKIEAVRRLAANIRARNSAARLTPLPLTEAQKTRVEEVTRFEQFRGQILRQNGAEKAVTNR